MKRARPLLSALSPRLVHPGEPGILAFASTSRAGLRSSIVRQGIVIAAAGLAVTLLVRLEGNAFLLALPVGLGLSVCGWLFMQQRLEIALVVVAVYLGLLDGFLKLRTGHEVVTLVRDALLYSVVLGALARMVIRKQPLPSIPRLPLVVAVLVTVLVQLANPADPSLTQTLGGLRPELEWMPMFFFGWTVIRTMGRLRSFFMLLLVIASINGVVTFVQFNLSAGQFASWGPGYAKLVSGQNPYGAPAAGRTFVDQSGQGHTRPFGLGSDSSFPGFLGFTVTPACLALLIVPTGRKRMLLLLTLDAGVLLLIVASQTRAGVIGTTISLIAFCGLAGTWRQVVRIIGGVLAITVVALVVGSFVSHHSRSGAFDRWKTIVPTHVFGAWINNKGHSLTLIPQYAVRYPLGAGIGRGGATTFLAGVATLQAQSSSALLDSETEITFLEHDVGLPGLIALVALTVAMIRDGVALVRRTRNSELRILLAALVAPLIAILAQWLTSPPTAVMPTAPFFWFAGGVIAWWGKKTALEVKMSRDLRAPAVVSRRRAVLSGAPRPEPPPATI